MHKEDLEFLVKSAKNNEDTLRKMSKDILSVARMLKKNAFFDPQNEDEANRFKTTLVQASFHINSFNLAVRSFNEMISYQEKNEVPAPISYFFLNEAQKMYDYQHKLDGNKEERSLKNDQN